MRTILAGTFKQTEKALASKHLHNLLRIQSQGCYHVAINFLKALFTVLYLSTGYDACFGEQKLVCDAPDSVISSVGSQGGVITLLQYCETP